MEKTFMVLRFDITTVAHDMRITMREHDNVPGRKRDSLAILDIRVGIPLREQVVNDHMPALRRKIRPDET
jgi:hypothetical protein